MAMSVPNRAFSNARRMVSNATRFAAASATLGHINYDPSSNHQINLIHHRQITAQQNADAQKRAMNAPVRPTSTRKNDPNIW
jgi:hypothetical protein